MDSARRSVLQSRFVLAMVGWAVATSHVGSARAQDPTFPEKEPNILLIVDASGSMEYMTGTTLGPDGERVEPTCDPLNNNSSQRSRWVELVEVLDGTIGNYRCETVNRRDPSFALDFGLPGGVAPSDANYRTPYHRPMSGSCGVLPGTVTHTNLFDFDRPAFIDRMSAADCTSTFSFGGDGLIDAYTSSVRFGLMTLDPLPNPGTGYLSPSFGADWLSGATGAFSYFYGTHATGHPVYCSSDQNMEVGVRNGAAPAWEGKMIAFGDPEVGSQAARHSKIKDVILSTRPYGASPIAGALTDAMTFLWDDESDDPLNASLKYSPKHDRYVQGGCRKQHIVLMTDGEPNLDLRPHCEATVNPGGIPSDPLDGKCPFKKPAEIIDGLKQGSFVDSKGITHAGMAVSTHIVGFASATTKLGQNCKTLSDADITSPTGLCATNNGADEELEICCNLHEMAFYGGDATTGHRAFFADDQLALRQSLGEILGSVVRGNASATQPVRSPGVGTAENQGIKGYRLLTSYRNSGGLWHGAVERLRWTCPTGAEVPIEQPKSWDEGDDFNFNISKDKSSLDARKFLTFVADSGYSERTLRPSLGGTNDGLGTLSGNQVFAAGNNISGAIPFENIAGGKTYANQIPACADLSAGSQTTCRDRVMSWVLGYAPDKDGLNHRCASPGNRETCSVIGDVLHSTPIIVDRPTAGVSDDTYERFVSDQRGRPMMAYLSSNDGQLHGFMVSPNKAADKPSTANAGNERFSLLPPAVLPLLSSQYPNVRLKLLDAVAVSQDVVAISATGPSAAKYPYRLERTLGNAQAADNTWRTILVQSLGAAGSGYFAVDITDVDPSSTAGPRFLWQITTDSATTPASIFGTGGTPLITTLSLEEGGVRKEVAVAVLPGGDDTETAGSCTRISTASDWSHIDPAYAPRAKSRCYAATSRARSVTIVRLDSGEVIRTFRATAASAGSIASTLVTLAPIDAPITGVPVAYPDGPGAIADRVFVGDRDGTLYKLDLTSPNPSLWKMTLFFDALGASKDKASRPDEISQAIRTRPTLSIDDKNQLVLAFATGEQDLSSTLEHQYVWSLTESVNAAGTGFDARANWYREFPANGEHVLGPPRLFSGVVYFSTYTPPSGSAGAIACNKGEPAIYGLHYRRPRNAADLSEGGEWALLQQGSTIPKEKLTATDLNLKDSAVIFGVDVEYAPQCYDVTESTGTMVQGSRASAKGATAPKMQLTFQTNVTTKTNENLNFSTNLGAVALAVPKSISTIESWAAILD